jgi:hypothetical protein
MVGRTKELGKPQRWSRHERRVRDRSQWTASERSNVAG